MRTGAAIARHPDWREALTELTGQIPLLSGEDEVQLALLFASSEYRPEFPDLVARAISRRELCFRRFANLVSKTRIFFSSESANVFLISLWIVLPATPTRSSAAVSMLAVDLPARSTLKPSVQLGSN